MVRINREDQNAVHDMHAIGNPMGPAKPIPSSVIEGRGLI
jgi:hypothetical protein